MIIERFMNYPFGEGVAVELPFAGTITVQNPHCTAVHTRKITPGCFLILTPRAAHTEVQVLPADDAWNYINAMHENGS